MTDHKQCRVSNMSDWPDDKLKLVYWGAKQKIKFGHDTPQTHKLLQLARFEINKRVQETAHYE